MCNCVGWPGTRSPSVKDWIVKYQIAAHGGNVANPDLTVVRTRRLNRVGQALDQFLDKMSANSPATRAVRAAWPHQCRRMASGTRARPGGECRAHDRDQPRWHAQINKGANVRTDSRKRTTTAHRTLSSTMRAARYTTATGVLAVVDVPVPEPGPGEVLVKIAFCGMLLDRCACRRRPRGDAAGRCHPRPRKRRDNREYGLRRTRDLGRRRSRQVTPLAETASARRASSAATPSSASICR